jgi:hypothetical protein
MMLDADLKLAQKEKTLQDAGHEIAGDEA